MKNPTRFAALAALVPLLAACPRNPFEDTVCTMEARPALHVLVSDARTGAPATGYTVVARAGSFADSATVPEAPAHWDPASGVSLAHEHAGRYEVTVRKAGYAEWRKSGVEVTRDECHVRTVRLEARLQPAL
ncbi:MAG TPA: hypothetical protein VGR37_00770 [Longimicrobiaceae bacterium]|nr:hypothetical protein [Longimicrobiaceae bacterium]